MHQFGQGASVPLRDAVTSAPWHVRTHRGDDAIDRLTPLWADLLRRVPDASAFSTPGWARAWWATYGRRREAVLVEIAGDGGETVGLLPLMLTRVPGLGTRVLEMLGGAPADWHIWVRNPHGLGFKYVNELLVEPGHELYAVEALRGWLAAREVAWDALRFTCVPAGSALAQRVGEWAAGWQPREQPFQRLRVDTRQSWEEYRASLSKRQRQDTRYKPNELTRAVGAELRLDVVSSPGGGLGAAVAEFTELFERRWTARGKPGLLPGEAQMYRHLAAEEPGMVVYRLLGGDRVLASQIGFDDGRRYTPYNYAFDPEFSEKSPSHVLSQMIIEHCCGDGHESVEQLTVAMGRHWSKDHTTTMTLEATAPGALSRVRAGALRRTGSAIRGAQTTTAGNRARAGLARVAATLRRR
ncbi:MAG TPA: GNAT family N-acetyltransferase [Candidatus Dormibacteraeota bacterium]|nr:GNAT family N-acetyltransferase [Candidatus Dormibacteraeota bacterium]